MSEIDDIIKGHVRAEVATENKKVATTLRKEVVDLAMKELAKARPIIVERPDKTTQELGVVHEMTETVLEYISARVPLLLVDPYRS